MENISQGSGDVRADATATAPRLRPNDAEWIADWGVSLLGAGCAAPSVERAQKSLRAFARRLPDGLLVATRGDVWAFFQDRQRALRQRQGTSAAAPVRLSLLRRPSWAIFVRSAKRFYGWLEARNLVSPTTNPFRGIREYPSTSPVSVSVHADRYDQMLHHPSLNRREAALLWLLAHGLAPSEVRLLATSDVDLESCEIHVRRPHRVRTVPLSVRAVARIGPWVTPRSTLGRDWLFPGRGNRPISSRRIGEIVQGVALRAFPGPSHAETRLGINPAGFRELFILRALRGGVSADCLFAMTGLTSAKALRAYMDQKVPSRRLHREFQRLTGVSRNWI